MDSQCHGKEIASLLNKGNQMTKDGYLHSVRATSIMTRRWQLLNKGNQMTKDGYLSFNRCNQCPDKETAVIQ